MLGESGLATKKNAPEILFGVGVVSMIGSTVLACRATLKMEDSVEATKSKLDEVKTYQAEDYSESDRKRDIAVVYTRGIFRVVKLYSPAIVVGGIGIACLTKSHSILRDRNNALAAAYIAVDTAFKQYRERVVEKYGKEVDEQLRYASEDAVVVDEKGKTKTVQRVGPGGASQYARFFDEYSDAWSPEPEYNATFLLHTQSYFNDRLRQKGHVFLNEVYDRLGLERSEAGAIVGWLKHGDGDQYIDFGVFADHINPRVRDFVNGREGSILLDFNVDGPIYNLLDTPQAST